MKIIEAIQEAMGPQYTTLADAINWWGRAAGMARGFYRCPNFKER